VLLGDAPPGIEKKVPILRRMGDVYSMGCVAQGRLFGSVLIFMLDGAKLENSWLVEAYIHQAAVAMQHAHTEQKLKNTQTAYGLLTDQIGELIVLMDTDGKILDVNQSACELLGYEKDTVVNRMAREFLDPTDPRRDPPRFDLLRTGQREVLRRAIRLADGSHREYECHLNPLFDGRILVVALDVTDRRRFEEMVLQISAEERRGVGRDLHDSLGQLLTGASLLSAALANRLREAAPAEAEDADRIAGLLREAVSRSRRIARGLCPVDVEGTGIREALQALAADIQHTAGVECRCDVPAGTSVAHDSVATQLYHIAQEAVTNAVRHGKAEAITISLARQDHSGVLTVTDDGVGLPDPCKRAEGMGLRTLRYRAEIIGGELAIQSEPKRGTTVRCSFRDRPTAL
jgi:two-component system CheB/CheR fusion protein